MLQKQIQIATKIICENNHFFIKQQVIAKKII